jgi:DNA-binding response OmpR family regulator
MSNDTGKTILVVDDEPDVVTYLGTFFQDNGFNVIHAKNGREGFERAKTDHPDLITLDITMPEESGVKMFRELQAESATADIPVIIITGVTSEFKHFLETRRQVDPPIGYFEKPINRDELLTKVHEILGIS